jgi:hypothetical protein
MSFHPNLRLLTLDNVGAADVYMAFDVQPTGANTDFVLSSGKAASLRVTAATAGRLYVYVSGLLHTGILNYTQEGSP